MIEFSPFGKSADEIRDLWKWVELRLNGGATASAEISREVSDVEFPIILSPKHAGHSHRRGRVAGAANGRRGPDLGRGCLKTCAHFWHFGHQKVERPFWVKRRITPPQPFVSHFSPSRS